MQQQLRDARSNMKKELADYHLYNIITTLNDYISAGLWLVNSE